MAICKFHIINHPCVCKFIILQIINIIIIWIVIQVTRSFCYNIAFGIYWIVVYMNINWVVFRIDSVKAIQGIFHYNTSRQTEVQDEWRKIVLWRYFSDFISFKRLGAWREGGRSEMGLKLGIRAMHVGEELFGGGWVNSIEGRLTFIVWHNIRILFVVQILRLTQRQGNFLLDRQISRTCHIVVLAFVLMVMIVWCTGA